MSSSITEMAQKALSGAQETVLSHTVGNAKKRQLDNNTIEGNESTPLTSYFGTKIAKTDVGLHAGERGPYVLNDFHAREKISKFDHERIPERVVHARGAAAHGHFKLHTAIPESTKAGIFNDTSKTVPIFLRFSTVAGSKGSADSVRDVRGFAIRFYTDEGNWDVVGNNIPIFFIQDAIQFPDLVHALKPEPHNEIPQAQTAHDNAWDWMSLSPQSAAMHMWIMSDRTIPRSFRMMPGFGVHTFIFVNAEGKRTFVKFHFKPQLGTHSLVWDEALKLAGQDPDFHRRDLWDAIEAGAYPKWDVGVQLVNEEDEHSFDFDLLDSTKFIPEDLVPVKVIGEFELNRNPTNYFAETEQVAFCTQHIVPGIDFSNDPLLAGRNFSYFDTQISRLGINFNDLPINRPVCPMRFNHRDGQSQHRIEANRTPYFPNRFNAVPPAPESAGGYEHFPEVLKPGVVERKHGPKFKDYFSQATLFYNSLTEVEKEHMVSAYSFELGKVDDIGVQEKMIERLNIIDHDLALQVCANFGSIEAPKKVTTNHGKKSEFLSLVDGKDQVFTATGRKVAIYVLTGFNYPLVVALKTALTAAGVIVMIVGPTVGNVQGSSGKLDAQFTLETCRSTHFDGCIFMSNDDPKALNKGLLIHAVRESFMHFKLIAFEGEATVKWGVNKCLPGEFSSSVEEGKDIKVEQGVVFAPASGTGAEFATTILGGLAKHRCWARDVSAVAA